MNKKPWISINAAQGEEIIKAIDACPSGALQYRVKENSNINPELAKGPGSLDYEETSPSEANPAVEIKVVNGGPFIIKGHTKLITSKGDIIREGHNMVLCRCAKSKNQPFCDGSHSRA